MGSSRASVMADDRPANGRSALPSRRERTGPGGFPVFKTGGAAPGAARWVRLPCAPASPRRHALTPDRARDAADAVERCGRRASNGSSPPAAATADGPEALAAVAREVVDDERARLAAGRRAGRRRGAGDRGGRVRLARLRRSAPRAGSTPGHQRDRGDRPHQPRPGAVAGRRRSRRRAGAGGYSCSSSTATTGRRGPRFRAAEEHLIALTGAEDALVTNNNAAAVALAVGLAGRGGGVAVSRGELVEIGGGVRIPEIVRRAGARLVEVGTTNRTRVADFGRSSPTAGRPVVLRVHPSNFTQAGLRRGARPGRARATSPTRTARSSSTTSAAVRCSTRRGSAWPTSRCRGSVSRRAPTS